MFIKIQSKEQRETIAGIAAVNGYQITPAKRKKKKGQGFDYGLDIIEIDGDYEETEDD